MNVIQKKLEVDDDDRELCSVVMFFCLQKHLESAMNNSKSLLRLMTYLIR